MTSALIMQLQAQLRAQAAQTLNTTQRATARRLYVGNLPMGLMGVEALLTEFINQAMIAAGLASGALGGTPVASLWLSAQQTFGFVEFRSEVECTNALNLNGVQFQGRALRVNRPADYVDPNAPPAPPPTLGMMNPLLAGIGIMPGPHFGGGMMGIGGGVQPAALQPVVPPEPPTRVLSLTNMITLTELEDKEICEEIKEDTIEECSKFGKVQTCVIPTPNAADAPPGPQDQYVGTIFVAFEDTAGAAAAKAKLDGRKFDGKAVAAKYFEEAKLTELEPTYKPPEPT